VNQDWFFPFHVNGWDIAQPVKPASCKPFGGLDHKESRIAYNSLWQLLSAPGIPQENNEHKAPDDNRICSGNELGIIRLRARAGIWSKNPSISSGYEGNATDGSCLYEED
jgi:hypothetical protein